MADLVTRGSKSDFTHRFNRAIQILSSFYQKWLEFFIVVFKSIFFFFLAARGRGSRPNLLIFRVMNARKSAVSLTKQKRISDSEKEVITGWSTHKWQNMKHNLPHTLDRGGSHYGLHRTTVPWQNRDIAKAGYHMVNICCVHNLFQNLERNKLTYYNSRFHDGL